MGHFPTALESPRCVLIGFNGATMVSLGHAVLLVEVGPITLNVKFSVVANISPYNAIT